MCEKVQNERGGRMYKTGELAKKAGVSIRTIRYYDSKGLLRPSAYSETGHRLYTEEDFSKLKRIIALKYLGLSLEEVMHVKDHNFDGGDVIKSLQIQKVIIKNKMHHMQTVLNAIEEAENSMEEADDLNWSKAIDIIKILEDEKALRQKYIDGSSLKAEIKLIDQVTAGENWYEWVADRIMIKEQDQILEIGCGDGALWYKNFDTATMPENLNITLTEINEDLLNIAKSNIAKKFPYFKFKVMDFEKLDYPDESLDIVIANHILFFINDVDKVLAEVHRVLKVGGAFYCTTIDEAHMQELENLLEGYDTTMELIKSKKIQNFGFDSGKKKLSKYFKHIDCERYRANLIIEQADEMLNYIYAMPGYVLNIADNKRKYFENHIVQSIANQEGKNFSTSSSHILFKSVKT